jgi:hypothetical protein
MAQRGAAGRGTRGRRGRGTQSRPSGHAVDETATWPESHPRVLGSCSDRPEADPGASLSVGTGDEGPSTARFGAEGPSHGKLAVPWASSCQIPMPWASAPERQGEVHGQERWPVGNGTAANEVGRVLCPHAVGYKTPALARESRACAAFCGNAGFQGASIRMMVPPFVRRSASVPTGNVGIGLRATDR